MMAGLLLVTAAWWGATLASAPAAAGGFLGTVHPSINPAAEPPVDKPSAGVQQAYRFGSAMLYNTQSCEQHPASATAMRHAPCAALSTPHAPLFPMLTLLLGAQRGRDDAPAVRHFPLPERQRELGLDAHRPAH
jgi:hypothetical protein